MWKPGQLAPGVDDRASENERAPVVFNAHARMPLGRQRAMLPIARYRDHLLYALEKHRVVVLVGETGCGKTTQIPQYLHEAGWTAGGRQVVVTQPRRLAAITVAARIAEEMGTPLGEGVGYAVRFDANVHSEHTRIKLVTDGLLLRETLRDPLLSRYSVLVLDEVHERSLHTDVLLGLVKKIRRRRPALRVIVSSATMDAEAFRDFFEDENSGGGSRSGGTPTATVLSVEGRQHPVEVLYREIPAPNYLRAAAQTVLDIHKHEGGGDILVFLPGREEIDAVIRLALVSEHQKPWVSHFIQVVDDILRQPCV